MEKLDTLDKKILNIVMENARIPSKDIALQWWRIACRNPPAHTASY